MTFLEALKTGRPMRRKSWWGGSRGGGGGDRWLLMTRGGYWLWPDGEEASPPLRKDYMADDWEVQS